MPCSVAKGEDYGVEVDWYSWGMMLVALFFGEGFNPAFTSSVGASSRAKDGSICFDNDGQVWWTSKMREQLLLKRLHQSRRCELVGGGGAFGRSGGRGRLGGRPDGGAGGRSRGRTLSSG